jgi:hypothetical protein
MSSTVSIVLAVLAVIVFFSIGIFAAVRFVHFLNRLPSPRADEARNDPAPTEPKK